MSQSIIDLYLHIPAQLGTTQADYLSGEGWTGENSTPEEIYKYGHILCEINLTVWARLVTRDIYDVMESITLKYDDGKVELPDFFKVSMYFSGIKM